MPRKLSKKQRREVRKFAFANWKILLVIFLLAVMLTVFAYYMGWLDVFFKPKNEDEDFELPVLTITFLDVGQADCMILQLPDGKNMIIDSGDFSSDQDVIGTFTNKNNITIFDYLLLTHSDRDHVGNMDWVIDNYEVKHIFRPNNYSSHDDSLGLPAEFNPVINEKGAYVCSTKAYSEFMVSAYNEQCEVEVFNKDSDFSNTFLYEGKSLSYSFDFLTPTAPKSEIKYSNANDYSPIVMMEYAGTRVMFNGDAEEDALEEYVDNYADQYNVDVLKVGHHGSHNATSEEFVDAIDPEYAVIQCGIGNDYGHPHGSALNRLTGYDSKMKIYRNDCNGTISLSISSNGQMAWSFENDDMTNNLLTGEEIISSSSESLNIYDEKVVDLISKIIRNNVILNYKRF